MLRSFNKIIAGMVVVIYFFTSNNAFCFEDQFINATINSIHGSYGNKIVYEEFEEFYSKKLQNDQQLSNRHALLVRINPDLFGREINGDDKSRASYNFWLKKVRQICEILQFSKIGNTKIRNKRSDHIKQTFLARKKGTAYVSQNSGNAFFSIISLLLFFPGLFFSFKSIGVWKNISKFYVDNPFFIAISIFGVITLASHVVYKTLFKKAMIVEQSAEDIEEKLWVVGKISSRIGSIENYSGWMMILTVVIYAGYLFAPVSSFIQVAGMNSIFAFLAYTLGMRYVLLGFYQLWGFLASCFHAGTVFIENIFRHFSGIDKSARVNPLYKLGEFLSIGFALVFFIWQENFKTAAFLIGLLTIGESIAGKMNSLLDDGYETHKENRLTVSYTKVFHVNNIIRYVLTFSPFILAGILQFYGKPVLAMGVLIMICAADIILGHKAIIAASHFAIRKADIKNNISDSVLVSNPESVYIDVDGQMQIKKKDDVIEFDKKKTDLIQRIVLFTRFFVWAQLLFIVAGVSAGCLYLFLLPDDLVLSKAIIIHFWFDILAPMFGILFIAVLAPKILFEKFLNCKKRKDKISLQINVTPFSTANEISRALISKYHIKEKIPENKSYLVWKTLEKSNYHNFIRPKKIETLSDIFKLKNVILWHVKLMGTITGLSLFVNKWRYINKQADVFLSKNEVVLVTQHILNGNIKSKLNQSSFLTKFRLLEYGYLYVWRIFLEPFKQLIVERGPMIIIGSISMGLVAGILPQALAGSTIINTFLIGNVNQSMSGFFFCPVFTGFLNSLTIGNLAMKACMAAGIVLINVIKIWQTKRFSGNAPPLFNIFVKSFVKIFVSLIVFQFSILWISSIAAYFNSEIFLDILQYPYSPLSFVTLLFNYTENIFICPLMGTSLSDKIFHFLNKNPELENISTYEFFNNAHSKMQNIDEKRETTCIEVKEAKNEKDSVVDKVHNMQEESADVISENNRNHLNEGSEITIKVNYKTVKPFTLVEIGDQTESNAYGISLKYIHENTSFGNVLPDAETFNVALKLGDKSDFRPASYDDLVASDPFSDKNGKYVMVCKNSEKDNLICYELNKGFYLEKLIVMGADASHYHLSGNSMSGVGIPVPDSGNIEEGFYRIEIPIENFVEKEEIKVVGNKEKSSFQNIKPELTERADVFKKSDKTVNIVDEVIAEGNQIQINIPRNSYVSEAFLKAFPLISLEDFVKNIFDVKRGTFRENHRFCLNDCEYGHIVDVVDVSGKSVDNINMVMPDSKIVIERIQPNITQEDIKADVLPHEKNTIDIYEIQQNLNNGEALDSALSLFEEIPGPEQNNPEKMFKKSVIMITPEKHVVLMPQGEAEVKIRDPQHPTHFHMGLKEDVNDKLHIYTIQDGTKFYRLAEKAQNVADKPVIVRGSDETVLSQVSDTSVLKKQGSAFHLHGKNGGHFELGFDGELKAVDFGFDTRFGDGGKFGGGFEVEFESKEDGNFAYDIAGLEINLRRMFSNSLALGGILSYSADEMKEFFFSVGAYKGFFNSDLNDAVAVHSSGGIYGGGEKYFDISEEELNSVFLTFFTETVFSFSAGNFKILGVGNIDLYGDLRGKNEFVDFTCEHDFSNLYTGLLFRADYGLGNEDLSGKIPLEISGQEGLGVSLGVQKENYAFWSVYDFRKKSVQFNFMIGYIGNDPAARDSAFDAFKRQKVQKINLNLRQDINQAEEYLVEILKFKNDNLNFKNTNLEKCEIKVLNKLSDFIVNVITEKKVSYFLKNAEYKGKYTGLDKIGKYRFTLAENKFEEYSGISCISIAKEMFYHDYNTRSLAELIGHELVEPYIKSQLTGIKNDSFQDTEIAGKVHDLSRIFFERVFEYDRYKNNILGEWILNVLESLELRGSNEFLHLNSVSWKKIRERSDKNVVEQLLCNYADDLKDSLNEADIEDFNNFKFFLYDLYLLFISRTKNKCNISSGFLKSEIINFGFINETDLQIALKDKTSEQYLKYQFLACLYKFCYDNRYSAGYRKFAEVLLKHIDLDFNFLWNDYASFFEKLAEFAEEKNVCVSENSIFNICKVFLNSISFALQDFNVDFRNEFVFAAEKIERFVKKTGSKKRKFNIYITPELKDSDHFVYLRHFFNQEEKMKQIEIDTDIGLQQIDSADLILSYEGVSFNYDNVILFSKENFLTQFYILSFSFNCILLSFICRRNCISRQINMPYTNFLLSNLNYAFAAVRFYMHSAVREADISGLIDSFA